MKTIIVDNVILGGGIVGTWVTKGLIKKGKKVAVIEIGPSESKNDDEITPPINFPEREHLGATKARNHVLTGNSRFWGGALIDNDEEILEDITGGNKSQNKSIARKMHSYYQDVADELKIPFLPKEKLFKKGVEITISEVLVLTGSKRDIWSKFYNNQQNLYVFCNAKINSILIEGNQLKEIIVDVENGEQVKIISKEFLLSMGVIDSNIFIMEHLKKYTQGKIFETGTCLHDHWSVPIGKFKWDRNSNLNLLFPPKFNNGQVIGRRISLRNNDTIDCNGFIHIQASYDTTPPYSVLKEIVFAKQKKMPISALLKESLGILPYFPTVVVLAYERFIKQRLYLPHGTELTVVLDFESDADKRNKIELKDGLPELFWNIRDKDYTNFINLFQSAHTILNDFFPDTVISFEDELKSKPDEYLMKNAIDAYHLGGGITMGANPENYVDLNLRFYDINNLSLVSTAMFHRPGIANPVYTLLTFAEYYINSIN